MYCFGHLLYEMTFGRELEQESCDTFPPECPAQLRKLLILYLLVLSADNFCKQFGPRSGPTKCWT